MPIYTLHGCTIDIPKGRQSARVTRPEIRDDAGQVIQSGATASFAVIPDGPMPEVQAQRWVLGLPRLIDQPAIPDSVADDATEVDDE